ncbi:MAG: tRNA 2-thiouridine(34) synthase MnmA [Treponema sp.]
MYVRRNVNMKVLVGLSGGVDSTIATKLLIDSSFDVTTCTLRLLPECTGKTLKDDTTIEKAKEVARKLGVRHIVYDCRNEFEQKVIKYFSHSYKMGQTPNPCYICNSNIKFGIMLEKALNDGFEKIATGHYAGIKEEIVDGNKMFQLLKGKDKQKDQSYFLSCLSQFQLSHSIFPLSHLTKKEVKEIAVNAHLAKEDTGESQDICFVDNGEYATFISSISSSEDFPQGDFIDTCGNKIQRHKGLQYYTVGQRRGLNIAMGYPVYVIKKDAKKNTVTVGEKSELFCHSLIAKNLNIIAKLPINEKIKIKAKTRYRQVEKDAYLILKDDATAEVEFFQNDEAVATGQVVAFYNEDVCIGSGIIETTF